MSCSYARGEETELSDVDILIEFTRPVGWEIVDRRTTWKTPRPACGRDHKKTPS
ncbi:nucleotidyltransferase domain-containing protein [Thermococcus sp.]|uniref:nucleotidyltransferase domain-containing protein n=1 Tax=Thermococcus sp. TaxID=35749 RepID=UPI003457F15D